MRNWKIVPVEPTPEMLEAGAWMEYGESSFTMQPADEDSVREVWDCMLKAAPGAESSAHADIFEELWESLLASDAHPHEFPSREQVREALCDALAAMGGKR